MIAALLMLSCPITTDAVYYINQREVCSETVCIDATQTRVVIYKINARVICVDEISKQGFE